MHRVGLPSESLCVLGADRQCLTDSRSAMSSSRDGCHGVPALDGFHVLTASSYFLCEGHICSDVMTVCSRWIVEICG